MKNNVLLIGAGQLGSRHLQGLLKSSLPLRIEIVEPSAENRKVAMERAGQVDLSGAEKEFVFHENLDKITISEASLAIIATNSDVRADVVSRLTRKVRVTNLILEKVVYQSIDTFKKQIELFNNLNIKAWVNCPRRIYDFYGDIRNETGGGGRLTVSVSGSNWGLGCNSLHFIDLFCYLTSANDCRLDYNMLDSEILSSKRKGFMEFTGRLGFSGSEGSLHLTSYNHSNLPVLIEITSQSARWFISEAQGIVVTYRESDSFMPVITERRFPFQSELTNKVAEEIITTGRCGLTAVEESFFHHVIILPIFSDHLVRMGGVEMINCPIT